MPGLRSTRTADRFAPWQPATLFHETTRVRAAAELLHRASAFPGPGSVCLEVGFGEVGWLAHLIGWGVREPDLHGVDVRADRVHSTAALLPAANLRLGNAEALPWANATFDLVIASMVFTAILDDEMRRRAAREIERVLAPGGVLLWYDIAVGNPWNATFRKVTRSELRALFAGWTGELRSIGLAPPVARIVARRSWALATLADAMAPAHPFLAGVLRPPGRPRP